MRKSFLFFALISFLTACSELEPPSQIVTLVPEKVDVVLDPQLQSVLYHLSPFAGGYAVTMDRSILVMDEQFQLLHTFGSEGQGPEEFMNSPSICVKDSLLYALDSHRLHILSLPGLKQLAIRPLPAELPINDGFHSINIDDQGQLWFTGSSAATVSTPKVIHVDQRSGKSFTWGQQDNFYDGGLHCLLPDSSFLWIPQAHGGIQRISREGKFLDSLPILGNEEYMRTRDMILQAHERNYGDNWENNGISLFFYPICLDNVVFIYYSRDDEVAYENQEPLLGRWLVLRWNPKLELIGDWETDLKIGNQYAAFCIDKDKRSFLAFEASLGEFHRIPFPAEFMEKR